MKYISDQTKAHFLSKSFRFEGSIYLFIFVTGLLLRLYEIANRAMHHDESLHAYYSWELSQGSGLIHNPMLHGPLQMELTALIFFLLGDSDTTARLLYAFAGSVLILLPVLIRNSLGKYGAITTATLLAISPTMVYFSRFARNDILMAVLAFGIVIAMWKYLVSGNKKKPLCYLCASSLMFFYQRECLSDCGNPRPILNSNDDLRLIFKKIFLRFTTTPFLSQFHIVLLDKNLQNP